MARPIAGCPAGSPAGCLHPFGCAPAWPAGGAWGGFAFSSGRGQSHFRSCRARGLARAWGQAGGYWYWRADSSQGAAPSWCLYQSTGSGAGTEITGSAVAQSGGIAGQWNYQALATPLALSQGMPYAIQYGQPDNFAPSDQRTPQSGRHNDEVGIIMIKPTSA
jgi:hypothetical protein